MYMQADLHTWNMLLRLTLYSNKCAPPFRSHGYWLYQVADGVGGSRSVSGHSPGGIHSNLIGHLRSIPIQEGSQKKVTGVFFFVSTKSGWFVCYSDPGQFCDQSGHCRLHVLANDG